LCGKAATDRQRQEEGGAEPTVELRSLVKVSSSTVTVRNPNLV